jgi:predicted glycoside hydrolase/deacetylase ChbG (UPF0249 family)
MEPTRKDSIRKTAIVGMTCLLWIIVLPVYAIKISLKQDYMDFDVYYRAAHRVKQLQWDQVYTLQDGASPFRYSPIFLPLFRPFAELTLAQARLVWFFFQYFCFILGLYWIFQSLKISLKSKSSSHPLSALEITCLASLFILRFCLDTFTIGQVSGLMFLGFCGGLYAWILRRPTLAVTGILIPTLFKIGPGFLFGIFLSSRSKERKKSIKSAITIVAGLLGLSSLWIGSRFLNELLWKGWVSMVANDSTYYDASHYGSQSIKSFLLRAVRSDWIEPSVANDIYLMTAILICSSVGLFWLFRRPRSHLGRGLFYSFGLFVYMWLMPETFKYSLTPLAIPVAFLFALWPQKFWISFALGFGVLTLSLAGKDLVGDTLFFFLQNHSIPLLATFFLGLTVFRNAWKESVLSAPGRLILESFSLDRKGFGPWKALTQLNRNLDATILVPVPLQKSAKTDIEIFRKHIRDIHHLFSTETPGKFEILFILYGDRINPFHPLFRETQKLALELNFTQVLTHYQFNGRAAALRTGFLASCGKYFFTVQIQQPCDVQFFKESLRLLKSDYDLVRANRRHSHTQFQIPVRLLPLVYGRHRLGLIFNRLVRLLLPIQTTDTHSGTMAFSTRLAQTAFALQTSPGFLFDLEMSLVSQAYSFREIDLPVALSLGEEKTIQQMIRETLDLLRGLLILKQRYRKGYYSPMPLPQAMTSDDWGLSAGINQGILKLAKLGVIKRVSIMANGAALTEGLSELCTVPGIELGIHFNLTYGRPSPGNNLLDPSLLEQDGPLKGCFISSPGRFLIQWIRPSGNKESKLKHVRSELICQLDKIASAGAKLSYFDGHHHIHLTPGLLDGIADILKEKKIHQVRLPYDPALWLSPQMPIVLLSCLLRGKLKQHSFQYLPCLYPRQATFRDQGKLRAQIGKKFKSEIIVHPAEIDDLHQLEFPDSYTSGRVIEFEALRMLRL